MQETAYFLLGVHFGWKRNKFSLVKIYVEAKQNILLKTLQQKAGLGGSSSGSESNWFVEGA